jgi:hypothetical protein
LGFSHYKIYQNEGEDYYNPLATYLNFVAVLLMNYTDTS